MKRSLIEQIHTYIRGSLRNRGVLPEGATLKAPGKTYPRMPRKDFPPLKHLKTYLTDALDERQSCRESSLANPLTFEELGVLLGHSLGAKTLNGKRPYPSGGGLFPLETYIIVNKIQSLERGVYHYDPDIHALEEMWPLPAGLDIPELMFGHEWTAFSSCILVFTCVWERSRKKYSDFAYLLSLIESGGAGQNIGLVATALGLCTCPVAGFDEKYMTRLLDLPEWEQPLYTITIGKRVGS